MDFQATDFDHNDPSFYSDPQTSFAHIRRDAPVLFSRNHGGYWLLTRFADVHSALLDWQRFSSVGLSVTSVNENWPSERIIRELPIASDPPEHTAYRTVIAPWFGRSRLAQLEAPIRRLARTLLRAALTQKQCDVVQDFAIPYILGSLAHFLGRPINEADLWRQWASGIFLGRTAAPATSDSARLNLIKYLDDALADQTSTREGAPDDFFDLLALSEIGGRFLDHEEMLGFGSLAFLAGVETTVNAVANAFLHLATHDDHRRRLADRPDQIPSAVEEILRTRSPVQLLGRRATVDVSIGDHVIPEGALVAMCYGAANGDESRFPNAGSTLLDRNPNPHLAFGAGRHRCIGSSLARLEIGVALEEALRIWVGWELDGAEEPVILPRGDLHGYWRLPVRLVRD